MRSPHTHFCQTNSLVRDSLIRLAEGHSLTIDGTRRTPFLPNKLAPPASPSTPFLPPVRRRRKQTSTVRAEHAPMPLARSRGIFPLPPHPQSDFAEPPLFTFRADLASAKGFHKRAVGFPQSKAKRGYPRERHGRLLNRGPRTIFDGGRRSKESVSGGR